MGQKLQEGPTGPSKMRGAPGWLRRSCGFPPPWLVSGAPDSADLQRSRASREQFEQYRAFHENNVEQERQRTVAAHAFTFRGVREATRYAASDPGEGARFTALDPNVLFGRAHLGQRDASPIPSPPQALVTAGPGPVALEEAVWALKTTNQQVMALLARQGHPSIADPERLVTLQQLGSLLAVQRTPPMDPPRVPASGSGAGLTWTAAVIRASEFATSLNKTRPDGVAPRNADEVHSISDEPASGMQDGAASFRPPVRTSPPSIDSETPTSQSPSSSTRTSPRKRRRCGGGVVRQRLCGSGDVLCGGVLCGSGGGGVAEGETRARSHAGAGGHEGCLLDVHSSRRRQQGRIAQC